MANEWLADVGKYFFYLVDFKASIYYYYYYL
jgi:hypothetical protein